MNSNTGAQSITANLPIEILDFIFSYLIDSPTGSSLFNLPTKSLSLVCRSWTGPLQRRSYQTTKVSRYAEWDLCKEVISRNAGLASYVRSVRVEVKEYPGNAPNARRWNAQDLSDLLQLFPCLTTLFLKLEFRYGGPGYQGDYSALATLPNLEHLSLCSDKFDKDLTAYRQILQKTPNIISLSLENDRSRIYSWPSRKRILPIDLPSLTRLSLTGEQLTRLFDKVKLLSEATLSNITDLGLYQGGSWRTNRRIQTFNAATFLQRIGGQLQTLRISQNGAGGLNPTEIFEHCPRVTYLDCPYGGRSFFSCPPSARTLYIGQSLMDPATMDKIMDEKFFLFGNLTTLKLDTYSGMAPLNDLSKQACVAKGLRLIIDGALLPFFGGLIGC